MENLFANAPQGQIGSASSSPNDPVRDLNISNTVEVDEYAGLEEQGLNIRWIFTPRPGKLFVRSDYAQLEVRIVAHYSQDAGLIAAIRAGGDMHGLIAHKVFKLDCEPHEVKKKFPKYRSAAKAVVFGLIYGISAVGLGNGLGVSVEEAQGYIDAFFQTYPGLKVFLEQMERFASFSKFSYNIVGRRRRFQYINSRALRQSKNFPIQSTASEITTTAMVSVDDRIRRENLSDRMQILMQIHDEILAESDIADVPYCMQLMQECMQEGLSKFGIDFAVPLLTDPEVNYAWGFPIDVAKTDELEQLRKLRTQFDSVSLTSPDHAKVIAAACSDYYTMYFRELRQIPQLKANSLWQTLPGNTVPVVSDQVTPSATGTPQFRLSEVHRLLAEFNNNPDYATYRAKYPILN